MKRADIQGLRAIAVLLVLLFHFETPLRGGYLGVDMFFVISGFVIASSTMREIETTNHFSWSAFLHRRVRRLLPGLAVVTLVTALLSMLLMSPFGPQQETAKMLLSAATYTSNFVLMPQNYFSLDPKANPMLHLWSLAVEEQFYFVWPIAVVALVCMRAHLQSKLFKSVIWTLVLGTLLSSGWLFLMSSINGSKVNDYRWFRPLITRNISPERFAFYSPFTRAWEFIAGVIVALLVHRMFIDAKRRASSLIALSGLALIVGGIFWATLHPEVQHGGNWSTNTSATMLVVAGTAFLIAGGLHDGLIRRAISVRPLRLIGDCSYSIYLFHWPIWVLLITSFGKNFAIVVVSFILSIGFGWLQFHYFEEPIRSKRKLRLVGTSRFVVSFALAAGVCFSAMSYTTPVIAMHLAGKKPDELSQHIIEEPCVGEQFTVETAQSCRYSAVNSQGSAVLLGDSMAKSLSDGFVQATNTLGLDSYVFSFPGCSFQLFDSPFTATGDCAGWRADAMNALQKIQPKVIVIANLSSLYVENPLPDWSIDETQQIWGGELKKTLQGLSQLNAQVIIAQAPPQFSFDLRYDVSLVRPNAIIEQQDVVVARRAKINLIEEQVVAGISYAQPIFNFTDFFCNRDTCNPRIDNELMLEDESHLTVDGSLLISPRLQQAMAQAFAN